MNDRTDSQLLCAYAENRSEAAFTELVRRHVDFVYSAALRMVCDPHLAEDVTQAVFVALAKSAAQLGDRPVLSGWLHRTAQNIAAQTVRTIERRRAREQEAAAMNELLSAGSEMSWEHIAPHLDTALGELSEPDRDAVLLRYFEKKSAQEIAEVFGVSAEAAQKRVSRAVERLREFFAKRGVTVGASGLVVVISANAVQAAPAGLAVTISTAAALGGTTFITAATATATKAIAMTTLQKTFVAATLAVAFGTATYEVQRAVQITKQAQATAQQRDPLFDQVQQLQQERNEATRQLAALRDENERLSRNTTELLKLRAEVTQLKSAKDANTAAGDDPALSTAKSFVERVNKLKQKLDETPGAKIPELQFLTDADWIDAIRGNDETEADLRRSFSYLRSRAEHAFFTQMQKALHKYIQANNDQFPTDVLQLKPYFDAPPGDDILQRYKIVPAASQPHVLSGGDWLITQKKFIDEENDIQIDLGRNSLGSASYQTAQALNILAPAMKALTLAAPADSSGRNTFTLQQLLPYLTTAEEKAAYKKLTHSSGSDSK